MASETWMDWTATTVGTQLGPVRVRTSGSGTPVVCSHPALVDGRYWEPLARALGGRVRIVLPDLPLGAQLALARRWRPGLLNDLSARGIPRALVDDWLAPGMRDDEVLDDLRHLLGSMRPDVTLGVLDALAAWNGPARVLWYRRGLFFPAGDGVRIATHLRAGPVRWVDDSRALIGWDAPDAVAAAVLEVAALPAPGPSDGPSPGG